MLKRSHSTSDARYFIDTHNVTRRHSFSSGKENSYLEKIEKIKNSLAEFKHSDAILNLHLAFQPDLAEIAYSDARVEDISAKDFVYCGTAVALPVNKAGILLDKEGRLMLIKGKEYNLFKGLIVKYTSGYKYQIAPLITGKQDIRFSHLYMNDKGLLIGDEKETGKSHIIKISTPEHSDKSEKQYISIGLEEYNKNNISDDLMFKVDENTFVSYFFSDNKLYLKSIRTDKQDKDISILSHEILLPLKKNCTLASVKRSQNHLQIEIKKGNKTRIYYINPAHISNRKLLIKKSAISHHKTSHLALVTILTRNTMQVIHSPQTEKVILVANMCLFFPPLLIISGRTIKRPGTFWQVQGMDKWQLKVPDRLILG
ncbi:hypothetical protein EHW64_08230 [Erwinia psidii]|uniref:hypothetical protein n=1 Tax=Erwinia psidii TaxID=69224 RepID=UPI00226B9294|nr:hypothetical protein [Erwinia psidii]MCX8961142.1 hypothetical protein [Erwinia psidii]